MNNFTRQQQIAKTKKLMDIIVYSSSVIDIAIAILVTLSYFHIGSPEAFLMPIGYVLTVTVALTVIMGGLLIYLKHYESVLAGFLNTGNHVKHSFFNFSRLSVFLARFKPSKYRHKL
ncbi:hypothetical protein EPN87_02600 [archaeon]|nr:MAG: hypothetical protein EPN87_02600 [archaeon]